MRRADSPDYAPDIPCPVCGYPIDTPWGYRNCDLPFCSEECAEEHIEDYEGYEGEEAEELIESIYEMTLAELDRMMKEYQQGIQADYIRLISKEG